MKVLFLLQLDSIQTKSLSFWDAFFQTQQIQEFYCFETEKKSDSSRCIQYVQYPGGCALCLSDFQRNASEIILTGIAGVQHGHCGFAAPILQHIFHTGCSCLPSTDRVKCKTCLCLKFNKYNHWPVLAAKYPPQG